MLQHCKALDCRLGIVSRQMPDHMLAVWHVIGQVLHEDAHASTKSGGRIGRQIWARVELVHICMTWAFLVLSSTVDTQQGAHLRNVFVMGLYGQTPILMQKETSFQKTHFITKFSNTSIEMSYLLRIVSMNFPRTKSLRPTINMSST